MTTVKLTIDGLPIAVAPGTTILAAARTLGLSIPTLCHVERHPGEPLLPACGTEEVLRVRLGVAGDARVSVALQLRHDFGAVRLHLGDESPQLGNAR